MIIGYMIMRYIRFLNMWFFCMCGKVEFEIQVFKFRTQVYNRVIFKSRWRNDSITNAQKRSWCRLKALNLSFRSAPGSFWCENYRPCSYAHYENGRNQYRLCRSRWHHNLRIWNLECHTYRTIPNWPEFVYGCVDGPVAALSATVVTPCKHLPSCTDSRAMVFSGTFNP